MPAGAAELRRDFNAPWPGIPLKCSRDGRTTSAMHKKEGEHRRDAMLTLSATEF